MLGLARHLIATGGLGCIAGTCAVDQDALLAVSRTRFGEGRVDLIIRGDIALTEHAPHFFGNFFATGFIHVEDGDLDALGGQLADRGFTKTRGTTSDDGRYGGIKFHGRGAPVLV